MRTAKHALSVTWIAAAGVAAALAGPAQQTAEAPFVSEGGDALFKTYCASCHGKGGKGDGPISKHLRSAPPDLTLLAARNSGTFDDEKVYRIVDGRRPISGHGGGDMPVWGDAFKQSASVGSEAAVKARIAALVEHLRSIQEQRAGGKPAGKTGQSN